MHTTLVPALRARYRYFIATGWLLATFEPMKTIRSLPTQSVYEHEVAAIPSCCLSADVLGEWQTRAALSIELVPIALTAFWAA